MTASRVATSADVPELVRVINAAYLVEQFFVTGDRTSVANVAAAMVPPDEQFLVIDHPDRAGVAGAVHFSRRGERGHFGMFAVDPSCQGRGLGRALIAAAERECRRQGLTALDLEVVNLRTELPPFYLSLGFVPGDTVPFPDPTRLLQPAHMIRMTKPIVGTAPSISDDPLQVSTA